MITELNGRQYARHVMNDYKKSARRHELGLAAQNQQIGAGKNISQA
ncbi:hypothetical protein [Sinorhizobium meliloti]|nr:hypothetical protein [Sinorhizobium meliloti]